jgi:rubredoxin
MDNPLKQYFRRPALYLKLPSEGKFYKEGSIELPDNKEVPIFPMTAIDEITSKTPDALFNGTAVADIIKSCVPNIKDPWAIPVMDIDPILISVRAATNSNEMDVNSICPACNEEGKYGVNLIGLLNGLSAGNYDDVIEVDELKFKFNPLSYKQVNDLNLKQFSVSQLARNMDDVTDDEERKKISTSLIQELNTLSVNLVSESIEYIATPSSMVTDKSFIVDFLQNCDKKTFELLKDTTIKLRDGSQLKPMKIKCVNCGHDYDQALTINVTDFFD